MSRITLALIASTAVLSITACSSTHASVKVTRTNAPAAVTHTSAPASSVPAAAGLTGTWSGQYSGAYQGTFSLHWRQSGSHLHGYIDLSSPPSRLVINGTVNGSSIRFGTVGSAGITYQGTVSGNSMSGTYQVHGGGGSNGGPWSASKK